MKFLKNIQSSKFYSDFLSTLGSNISNLGIGLFSSILIVRYLGADGMGEYTILTSFSLLFVSLAELGIRQSNIYFIAKDESSLDKILSSNFFLWILSSVIGICAFWAILFYKELDFSNPLLLLASLVIPVTIANKFVNGVMVGKNKIAKNSKYNFLNGIVKFGSVLLFIVLLQLNVVGALIVLIIPSLTNLFRKIIYLNSLNKIRLSYNIDFIMIKKLIGHGFLFGFALFLMTNQKKIPIYVMSGEVSDIDVGLYGVGLTFAGLVYQLFTAISPIIFVKSAKSKDPHKTSLDIQKLMRVMIVVLILASIVISVLIDSILLVLYGVEFQASAQVTRIMLLGIIFYNIFLVLNMDMAGKGKPWLAIYTLIPVSIISLIMNYIFIRDFGIVGAAFSTSLAMGIASFIYLFFYSREVKMSISQILIPRKSDWIFLNKFLNK